VCVASNDWKMVNGYKYAKDMVGSGRGLI
jgi:hypothetical protein